jgi:hypothetical protein
LLSTLAFAIVLFVEARFIGSINVTLVMVGVLVLHQHFLCRPLEPAIGSDTYL